MEFVYSVARQYSPSIDTRVIAHDVRDQVTTVRDAGFDGITVGEHHVTDDTYLLNEAVLAFAAPLAGDMHVSTGVCLLPYHNPVRIAEYGATMDVLTGGRFRLGVGLGYRPAEFAVFGVERSDAPGRLQEGIEVITRLWTEDDVTFDGEYFQYDHVSINPQPLQDPRPPIIVAASNEGTVRRAARIGDGWWGAHVPFDLLAEYVDAFHDEDDGDGTIGVGRRIFVAETDEAAEHAVKGPLLDKYDSYVDWGQSDVFESDTFEQAWEELKDDRFIIGSPATVIEDIERYQTAFDLDFMSVSMQYPEMTFDDARSSVELFGHEVLPHLS